MKSIKYKHKAVFIPKGSSLHKTNDIKQFTFKYNNLNKSEVKEKANNYVKENNLIDPVSFDDYWELCLIEPHYANKPWNSNRDIEKFITKQDFVKNINWITDTNLLVTVENERDDEFLDEISNYYEGFSPVKLKDKNHTIFELCVKPKYN